MRKSSVRACRRKVKYTKRQAKEQIIIRGSGGDYYRCTNCGYYHVTKVKNYISHFAWRKIKSQ